MGGGGGNFSTQLERKSAEEMEKEVEGGITLRGKELKAP